MRLTAGSFELHAYVDEAHMKIKLIVQKSFRKMNETQNKINFKKTI